MERTDRISRESQAMNAELFDEFVEDYEAACARGLALSGESRDYFAQQRVHHTAEAMRGFGPIRRILDFGAGLGHTTPYLLAAFPDATVIGMDSSAASVRTANETYGGERATFVTSDQCSLVQPCDLVYSNGTFHHIDPSARVAEVRQIHALLGLRSRFALWENNPWNPGTRLVMKRIPFDRDAQTLSYREAGRMLQQGGFQVCQVQFHFYFPAALQRLRPLERFLQRVPLGAQYCVVADRI